MWPIREFLTVPSLKPSVTVKYDDLTLDVSALRLEPGDVVCVSTDRFLSMSQMDEMQRRVCSLLPTGTKVLILDSGLEIGVIRTTGGRNV
jgi:hypothetical protein